MQDHELRVTGLLDHAARQYGSRQILTRYADGSEAKTDWAGIRHDALRMAQALRRLGLAKNDRVATLAMNHARHLVSWFGAVGAGGVLHTINPRLFDDQLIYIINHAEDRILLYDRQFQPLVDRLRAACPVIEHAICFDDAEPSAAGESAYDRWIGAESGDTAWVTGSERDPCMLCYTSGTTGHPKGVLYEHRSTVLHAMATMQPAMFGIDTRSVIMPIVPMYHAASWGLPWAGAAAGAKFVYMQSNDPAWACDLMRRENVTHGAGVPTVWLSVLQHVDAGGEMPPLRHVITGGSAAPRHVVERLMREGVRIAHVWGMTEISPIGTVAAEPDNWDSLSLDEQVSIKCGQGRTPYGVELRIVALDDPTRELERDGKTPGSLQVRGPWVVRRYFKADEDATGPDQWFDTGDVALLGPDGSLQITDRTKDVIKSGGEWISSVDLENAAMSHPAVAEAAAIGVPHPKWDERPLLAVVRKPGASVTAEEIRAFLADRIARWWLPDAIEFVDELPHTGTGKVSKIELRDMFRDFRLDA